MSAVGEAYGTGSFASGSLAINARLLGAGTSAEIDASSDPITYLPVRLTDGKSFVGKSAGMPPENAFGDFVTVEMKPVVQTDFGAGLLTASHRIVTRKESTTPVLSSKVMVLFHNVCGFFTS